MSNKEKKEPAYTWIHPHPNKNLAALCRYMAVHGLVVYHISPWSDASFSPQKVIGFIMLALAVDGESIGVLLDNIEKNRLTEKNISVSSDFVSRNNIVKVVVKSNCLDETVRKMLGDFNMDTFMKYFQTGFIDLFTNPGLGEKQKRTRKKKS